ncbi:T9SS type A sorting domain-containing protein [Winogradskyella thalassocola]|uniref:Por secretion system C-terminal sorting domain-containing protein n=1 Tax=Winogradskyella thalassocola TaxID=262004 RepID=A0A1G8HWW2_9FLAO|nr:M64 family metallopeptidase [Winogradskyella thalassocola]SDI11052.1 Por secretion system C-terminal sorting domain-containing protein [Winogradskyella thalassocola]
MKKLLLLALISLTVQLVFSQTFDVQAIKNSGDDVKRINLVILSEGYQASEMSQFETDATNFMNDMFSQVPFVNYENYFNVHIIKVPSNESGATHPGTASDEPNPIVPTLTVDNYFGTAYDSYDIHRLLYTENAALISTVLANNFPLYDQALILVNSPYYGGSGGQFPITSTGEDASEIAIHELGHSFVDLKDEYYPGDILAEEGINMTQETDPTLVKWKNWIGSNSVSIFPYATSGTASTWNRPHQSCKMRYLGYDFCAVCKEGIIERIHDLISPIDSYMPTEATITEPNFPLNFQLNTIQTLPTNTLESTWTLNGNDIATNEETVAIEESDLTTDTNNLTVVVRDATSLIDIDNHETIHVATVTWTIDNTLGVQQVSANDFSLTMFPNPANSIVNIKLENVLNENVVVEIISLDGKKIKSAQIYNDQNTSIDISTLSNGLYITNFYAKGILIASKKLIKN